MYKRTEPSLFPRLALFFWNKDFEKKFFSSEKTISNLQSSKSEDLQRVESSSEVQNFLINKLTTGANSNLEIFSQAYCGHQFGHFNILGDGRAHVIGDVEEKQKKIESQKSEMTQPNDSFQKAHLYLDQKSFFLKRYEIQLKGSGATPFSRNGDGRAALGPMIRELLVSECLAGLNISTTRCLGLFKTGEIIQRRQVEPGAIMVRAAESHVRVGTFQWAAYQQDRKLIQDLADYCWNRIYKTRFESENSSSIDVNVNSEIGFEANFKSGNRQKSSEGLSGFVDSTNEKFTHQETPYFDKKLQNKKLFEWVIDRQAKLVAQWMNVGFIHGVLNTDNVSIAGETLDFGPCAFLNEYDPLTVFSSIDIQGRYAFGQQPSITQWNLARWAECLIPVILDEKDGSQSAVQEVVQYLESQLEVYPKLFSKYYRENLLKRLGIFNIDSGDGELVDELLRLMHENHLDYHETFLYLTYGNLSSEVLTKFLSIRGPEDLPLNFNEMRESLQKRFSEKKFICLQDWNLKFAIRLQTEKVDPLDRLMRMSSENPIVIARNYWVEKAIQEAVEEQKGELMGTLLEAFKNPFNFKWLFEPISVNQDLKGYQTFCGT